MIGPIGRTHEGGGVLERCEAPGMVVEQPAEYEIEEFGIVRMRRQIDRAEP